MPLLELIPAPIACLLLRQRVLLRKQDPTRLAEDSNVINQQLFVFLTTFCPQHKKCHQSK